MKVLNSSQCSYKSKDTKSPYWWKRGDVPTINIERRRKEKKLQKKKDGKDVAKEWPSKGEKLKW